MTWYLSFRDHANMHLLLRSRVAQPRHAIARRVLLQYLDRISAPLVVKPSSDEAYVHVLYKRSEGFSRTSCPVYTWSYAPGRNISGSTSVATQATLGGMQGMQQGTIHHNKTFALSTYVDPVLKLGLKLDCFEANVLRRILLQNCCSSATFIHLRSACKKGHHRYRCQK